MRLLLAATLVIALAGCDSASDIDRLDDGAWALVSGADAVGAEVRFGSDGEFSARPVCNDVFGTYAASAGRIEVEVRGSTYAHCGDGMEAEIAFNGLLEEVTRYGVEGGQLTLAGSGAELVFERRSE